MKVASRLSGIKDRHIITIKHIKKRFIYLYSEIYNQCSNANSTSKTNSSHIF